MYKRIGFPEVCIGNCVQACIGFSGSGIRKCIQKTKGIPKGRTGKSVRNTQDRLFGVYTYYCLRKQPQSQH